jgi:hypothetical protein
MVEVVRVAERTAAAWLPGMMGMTLQLAREEPEAGLPVGLPGGRMVDVSA